MSISWPWILLLRWSERREHRRRIAEELRFHLDEAAAESRALGLGRRQAKAAAASRLGDRRVIQRECLAALDDDAPAGPPEVRRAKRLALITSAAVGPPALALLLLSHHLRPLPMDDPTALNVSQRLLADAFATASQSPETTAAFRSVTALWETPAGVTEASGFQVSSGFFRVQGASPTLGSFSEVETPCLVLDHSFWRERFGGDPDVTSSTVVVDGKLRPVCAVMPPGYWFLERSRKFWVVGLEDRGGASAGYLLVRSPEPPDDKNVRLISYSEICRGTLSAAIALFESAIGLLAALGMAQVVFLRRALGGWRKGGRLLAKSYLFLMAKGLPVLAAPAILWTVAMESAALVSVGYFSKVWFLVSGYLLALALTAIVWRVVADQETRCPVCQRDLYMPVALGVTGSILFDLPAVEYICAYGHGTLYRPEPTSEGVREPSWSREAGWWDALLGAGAPSTGAGG